MARPIALAFAACALDLAGQAQQATLGTMPRDKAEATFKDQRVVNFLKTLNDAFKETCAFPNPSRTKAQVTLPNIPKDAPPDATGYASTYYEVNVPCSAKTSVTVNAEFTPLTGENRCC